MTNPQEFKMFDEQFRFRSDELNKDGNYDGTVLRNDLIAFIQANFLPKSEVKQVIESMSLVIHADGKTKPLEAFEKERERLKSTFKLE